MLDPSLVGRSSLILSHRGHEFQFLREVAGSTMLGLLQFEIRDLVDADLLGVLASGMESAPSWRMDQIGNIPWDNFQSPLNQPRIGNGG